MSISKSETVAAQNGAIRRSPRIFTAIAVLALIGLADAIYLTVEHLAGRAVRCTVTGRCNEVLNSAYSSIGGVPLAALGALAYFLTFSLSTLSAFGSQLARKALFYLVSLMFLYSIWLFIVQAFVLHAFCQFCLLSGAVTLLLAILVVIDRIYAKRK